MPDLSDLLAEWSDRDRYGWSAFAARNLLLEDRVPERWDEYERAMGIPYNNESWLDAHRAFDLEVVQGLSEPARRVYNKKQTERVPGPFRRIAGREEEPLSLAPEQYLLHLATAFGIARDIPGVSSDDIMSAIAEADAEFLDDALEVWWRARGRCMFAGLADDVSADVEGATALVPGWANRLRNRFGLVHLEPLVGPIDVVLLRFRVADVPRVVGLREQRPLAAPLAFDSALNVAYCPHSDRAKEGRCVNLGAELDPVREIVCITPNLTSKHVIATGQVDESVPDLVWARTIHLEWVRDSMGPVDYAKVTDGDLAA